MRISGKPIIGRKEELRQLDELLLTGDRRQAHFIAVSGEPGIGKTRLLAELGMRADGGWLVLEGRATEFERDVPFAVLTHAIADYLASLHPSRLQPLGQPRIDELSGVFPEIADLASERRPLEADRHRLHRALGSMLELFAARKPTLLILDDVHWADPASVQSLLHLARHPPDADVVLVMAFRPAQVDPVLPAQLETAAAEGNATLLRLPPLSTDELSVLLSGEVAGKRLPSLCADSGGNPFYALQLARAPATATPGRELSGPATDAPPTVVAAIERELRIAGDTAQRLLLGAAVAGDPFELRLAATAAELPPEETAGAVDELLRLELVQPTDVPASFRFRHPIVRAAVYRAGGAGWRIGAHARIAAELEHRGAAAVQRAHHIERSAEPGDLKAVEILQEAAMAARPRAPASAVRWLEAAVRLTPESDSERRLTLLVSLAQALAPALRLEEAGERVREALQLLPPGAVEERARLAGYRALLERWAGRQVEADAGLRAAREALPEEAIEAATELDLELLRGVVSGREADPDVAERVMANLPRIDDQALRCEALAAVAAHAAYLARPSQALDAAAELCDALSDDELGERHGLTIQFLGNAEIWSDRYRDSSRHFARGLAYALETGEGRGLIAARAVYGFSLTVLGSPAQGLELAREAVEAAHVSGAPTFRTMALMLLGLSALEAGGLAEAQKAFEESRCHAPGHPLALASTVGLAAVHLERGAPERCLELLRRKADELAVFPLIEALHAESLVRSCSSLGLFEEARAHAAETGLGTVAALPVCGSMIDRGRAGLLIAEGSPAEAAEVALSAADRAGRAGAPIQASRSRIVAATALDAAGERRSALTQLESAHRDLAEIGTVAWRDAAAQEMRRLGRRVTRRGSSPTGGPLSTRETEVAELVAEGRTNKEIAAALFVSEKTVEKHLGRVFEKLGVSRRGAVAAKLPSSHEGSPA